MNINELAISLLSKRYGQNITLQQLSYESIPFEREELGLSGDYPKQVIAHMYQFSDRYRLVLITDVNCQKLLSDEFTWLVSDADE